MRIEFFNIPDVGHPGGTEYRWRTRGLNGEIGAGAEGYTRRRDAYLSAIDWLGVAERSDLTVPDERDRLALARLLHKAHPEVTEQAWVDQLDPDTVMEVSAPDLLRAARVDGVGTDGLL